MSAYTGYESYSDTELIRICRDSATSRCFVELIQRVEKIADGEFEYLQETIKGKDDEIEQLEKEVEDLHGDIRRLENQLDIANSTIDKLTEEAEDEVD